LANVEVKLHYVMRLILLPYLGQLVYGKQPA
jgi:hypothetical protein